MKRNAWIYAAATLAIAAASALSLAHAQQPPPAQTPSAPQTVPGSIAPAATSKVTAEAKAVAVVPDPAQTPLAIKVNDPNLKWAPCPPLFAEGCRIAVLRGDPTKPGADVFFQVPGGYTIAPHLHTSAERMVLVGGEMEVTYQGRSPIVLQHGQYAYGPPKAPHGAKCRSREPCTLFIAFDLPVDAIAFDGKL
jgi:quercetin dioxygenase-like cupin family protein